MANLEEGTLVTGRASHEIFVIRDGKRRWVPDAWAMNTEGLSPADLAIADDAELGEIPVGDELKSAIPPATLGRRRAHRN